MHDWTDHELWEAGKVGNGRAFAVLFDRHHRKVYNYCFRRTADWAVAEDLASATFLEAWRRRDFPVIDDSALPLLLGIATNLARNHARSLRRYHHAVGRLPRPRDTEDHADAVAERLDDQRMMAALLAALQLLKPRERDVLTLTTWSGLTYAQTAAALGIPVGTVRSTASRAREKLAEILEPAHGSGHYRAGRVTAAPAPRS